MQRMRGWRELAASPRTWPPPAQEQRGGGGPYTTSRPRPSAPRVSIKARTKPSAPQGSRRTLADKLEDSRATAWEGGSIPILDSEDDHIEPPHPPMELEPPTEVD